MADMNENKSVDLTSEVAKQASEDFKNRGSETLQSMDEASLAQLGCLSDKVEVIAALVNPCMSIKDKTPFTVGYEVRALADNIPFVKAPLNVSGGYDPLNATGIEDDPNHKAGEIVVLTKLEMILLLSKKEFSAKTTVGEFQARLGYRSNKKNPSEPIPKVDFASANENAKIRIKAIGTANSENPKILDVTPKYQEKFGVLSDVLVRTSERDTRIVMAEAVKLYFEKTYKVAYSA